MPFPSREWVIPGEWGPERRERDSLPTACPTALGQAHIWPGLRQGREKPQGCAEARGQNTKCPGLQHYPPVFGFVIKKIKPQFLAGTTSCCSVFC